jgi:tetratricopeptide (TPR) repeat protein
MASADLSPYLIAHWANFGRFRAIAAAIAFVASAWVPTIGLSEEAINNYPGSEEECLASPTSECLLALAIKIAKSEDSPGTLMQELSEVLLQQGERERAKLVLGDAIGLGFDAFSAETGFGANSDLWTVSRLSRLLTLLNENGFRDLQLEVVALLDDFLERAPTSNAKEQALYTLFEAFLNLGDLDQALSTARRAGKWAWYTDVAVALAEAGRVDEALEITKRIGNLTHRETLRARVASVLAAQGRIELAQDLLSSGASDIEITNAHKAIASALIANGQIEEAVAYANGISDTFQRAFVQDSTSGALAEAGDLDSALTLAKSISVHQQRSQAMATVGEILVSQGEVELARDVLEEIPQRVSWKNFPLNLWQDPVDESAEEARARLTLAIITFLAAENRDEEAYLLLSNNSDLSSHLRVRLKLGFAKALAQRGEETETLKIIEELIKVSSLGDNYKRFQLKASIGDLYIQIGHFEEARAILFRLDEVWSGSAVQHGAYSLTDLDDIDAALEWMSFLKADGLRRPVFLYLVQHLGRTGRSQEALALIRDSSEPTNVKIRAWISLASAIG